MEKWENLRVYNPHIMTNTNAILLTKITAA